MSLNREAKRDIWVAYFDTLAAHHDGIAETYDDNVVETSIDDSMPEYWELALSFFNLTAELLTPRLTPKKAYLQAQVSPRIVAHLGDTVSQGECVRWRTDKGGGLVVLENHNLALGVAARHRDNG